MRQRGFLEKDYKIFYIADREEKIYPSHCHGFHKIVVVLGGRIDYMVEGRTYQINGYGILFVKKNQVHHLKVYGERVYERLVFYLSEPFIDTIELKLNRRGGLFGDGVDAFRPLLLDKDPLMRDCLMELRQIHLMKNDFKSFLEENVLKVLLSKMCVVQEDVLDNNPSAIVYDKRIVDSLSYISKHLQNKMTVELLAEKVFLSRYHFMRLFKNQTGLSVYQYIIQKRLVMAHDMILSGTDYQKAALEVGFSDYSVFLKAFIKKYGSSPRKYFKNRLYM